MIRLVSLSWQKKLEAQKIEILSSGGTYKILNEAGVKVVEVSDYTESPEVMGGRVKTLHPRVHGGILYRRNVDSDLADLKKIGGEPIDMVVVNLYPFREATSKPDCDMQTALENIDIGGPSMIRSAAKNWPSVLVVVDPSDYNFVVDTIKSGEVSNEFRKNLATKAFMTTCEYDSLITNYLSSGDDLPNIYCSAWIKESDLRYGENPHQRAALYKPTNTVIGPDLANSKKLQGKEISYNNLLDTSAAIGMVREFNSIAAVVVKHSNPCGIGLGDTVKDAFVSARDCDPLSAFGGIVAVNDMVDSDLAEEITSSFYEVVVAPQFSKEALAILSKKKNLRLLEMPNLNEKSFNTVQCRLIYGGLLIQDDDVIVEDESSWKVASERNPTPEERYALSFAWKVVKHVKSNAIVFCTNKATVGIGAGQMSRVDSVKLAIMKAQSSLKGTVLASDAFFPFPDGITEAANAGVTAIIQPGGSKRDDEVVAAVNERNIAMIFTGKRHFRH